jgi:hypothetical protein
MDQDVFLLDSPAIERAVMAHDTVTTGRRRFGKSSLNEIPAGASGGEYNGYFKLLAVPDGDVLIVYIVNGAEFNLNGIDGIELGTNLCRINNQYYDVPGGYIYIPNFAENEIKTIYLLLGGDVNNRVAFGYAAELPAEGTYETYVVLGRVSATRIWQDSYGIPQILWFSPCVGFEEPEEA